MAETKYKDDGPVVFVGAKRKAKKDNPNSYYIQSKTMDLNDIIAELGPIVQFNLVKAKNAEDENDRLVIFKQSDRKYLPKKRTDGGGSKERKPERQQARDAFVD